MTIRKGETWGRTVARPPDLRIVDGDRLLAAALADGDSRPVGVRSGDLSRTLGARVDGSRAQMQELPIDLMRVSLSPDVVMDAVAHVVVRAPACRGSWWREEVLFVMNAQFLGRWNVVPRGHPNDGRADIVRVDPALRARQRLLAARRAPAGGHLPHPGLSVTRSTTGTWTFPRAMVVIADGQKVGSTRELALEVLPDAALVYV